MKHIKFNSKFNLIYKNILNNIITESVNVLGDKFEKDLANNITKYFINNGIKAKAIQTLRGTKYSDIEILDYNDNLLTFIEAKLNHSANLFSKRFNVRNGLFVPMSANDRSADEEEDTERILSDNGETESSPNRPSSVSQIICNILNSSQEAHKWLIDVAKELKIEVNDLNLTSTAKISPRNPNWSIFEKLRDYFKDKNKYILKQNNFDLKELLISHYTLGKAIPASYIQIDDDFYKINDKSDDKIKFIGVPYLNESQINGKCHVRISIRSHGYEIIPELKVTSKMNPSPFSFKYITNVERLPKVEIIDNV